MINKPFLNSPHGCKSIHPHFIFMVFLHFNMNNNFIIMTNNFFLLINSYGFKDFNFIKPIIFIHSLIHQVFFSFLIIHHYFKDYLFINY